MSKRIVEVYADMKPDGSAIPVRIVTDGMSYEVERVLQSIPLNTTKSGGTGHRYDVMISGRPNTLYFEYSDSYTDSRRWYIEQ